MVRLVPGAAASELTTKLPLPWRYPLNAVGRDQRAFRLISANIDETNEHAGEGAPAFGVDGVVDNPRTIGQMAAVPAGKGAGNRDIVDRIVIVVAQRERHQGLRSQTAPAPGLR